MSLIITNNKNLKNIAIIILSNKKGIVVEEKMGDLVLIKIQNEVVGINVFNYKKHFSVRDGSHTINREQIDRIAELGYQIQNVDSKFSVGEVVERKVHPKTNKLYLLKVKTDRELQIVTNAANAEVGAKVVVANIGATLPSGLSIVLSKVMGVESQGMLCGGETLGLKKTEGVLLVDGIPGEKFTL